MRFSRSKPPCPFYCQYLNAFKDSWFVWPFHYQNFRDIHVFFMSLSNSTYQNLSGFLIVDTFLTCSSPRPSTAPTTPPSSTARRTSSWARWRSTSCPSGWWGASSTTSSPTAAACPGTRWHSMKAINLALYESYRPSSLWTSLFTRLAGTSGGGTTSLSSLRTAESLPSSR